MQLIWWHPHLLQHLNQRRNVTRTHLRVNFSKISMTVQEKCLKHCEFLLFCRIIQTHSLQHMHPGLTVSRIPFQIKAQKLCHVSRDSPTFLHVALQDITKGISLILMDSSLNAESSHFLRKLWLKRQKKKKYDYTYCIVAANQIHEYKSHQNIL